jgi:hypothetical protein
MVSKLHPKSVRGDNYEEKIETCSFFSAISRRIAVDYCIRKVGKQFWQL